MQKYINIIYLEIGRKKCNILPLENIVILAIEKKDIFYSQCYDYSNLEIYKN